MCGSEPSQELKALTSEGRPSLVKSPACTRMSPSGMGSLMASCMLWVSLMQTTLTVAPLGAGCRATPPPGWAWVSTGSTPNPPFRLSHRAAILCWASTPGLGSKGRVWTPGTSPALATDMPGAPDSAH